MKDLYYKAYDERYKKVHENNLSWSSDKNSEIVEKIINKYNISKNMSILELGCGEGRDARYLLNKGYNVLATDVSEEAIKYCKEKDQPHSKQYATLDILNNNLKDKFDFIYSIACIHMLVLDEDRNDFYKFIYNHLNDDGYALIVSMGDGKKEYKSNVLNAYKEVKRVHGETSKEMYLPQTSCRIISMNSFILESTKNNLKIISSGITSIVPEFKEAIYILIKKGD